VLLIEDEPEILQAVATLLTLAGCQPQRAATGGDALALCDRHAARLAAVLLDLHLPGEDCAKLFAALRARRPDLPIILTSGLSEGAARERLGRNDVAGFLAKPFSLAHLVKTLEGALDWPPAPVERPAALPQRAEAGPPPEAPGFTGEAPPAAEPFECWFPRHVAEAVRSGEVPEQVLSRLQASLAVGGDASADRPRRAAVQEIAELAGIPPAQAAAVFGALQRLPGVTQEQLARRIVEAWLERQRRRYRAGAGGGQRTSG
jgi:CheY-like chemotaxis protein